MANTKITEATTVIPRAGDLLPLGRPGDTTALNTLVSGISLISQGDVTSSVDAVDIDLPDGYDRFVLVLTNFRLAGGNGFFSLLFSEDGGLTFPTDIGTYSDYQWSLKTIGGAAMQGDAAIMLHPNDSGDVFGSFVLIDAGNASRRPTVMSSAWAQNDFGIVAGTRVSFTARQNCLRIADYFNNVPDPAPSGPQIESGSYALLGVPS